MTPIFSLSDFCRTPLGLNTWNGLKVFQLKPRYPCRHIRTWKTKTPFLSFFCSGSNVALQEFLHARNPKNQHSGTLESYLIKPIQVNVLALQENNVTLIVAYGDV